MRRDFPVPAQLEPFLDTPSTRVELAAFLQTQFLGEGACTEEMWLRRFRHWWDENPFREAHPCRGWCLRDEGKVVGYLGAIPTFYEDASGKPVPALIATSWAVAEGHRHASLPMGMMLQRQGRELLMVDTTPSPEVQALLHRWGWTPSFEVRRSLVLRGVSAAIFAEWMNASQAAMKPGCEITTDLSRVKQICPDRPGGCVQKHITPEYLHWYLNSTMRKHHFLGVVDAGGTLSSYLMLIQKPVRGVPTWKVMDWFTTKGDSQELVAMVGWLMSHSPADYGNWWPFISLVAFSPDDPWQGVPQIFAREQKVSHFHWLPPQLKGQPIRPVMAEGDWGL